MTAVIQTDALTKKYRRVAALDHVNLEVQEGTVYAVVGQNGAGKTTAIKILMNPISASQGTGQVLAPIPAKSAASPTPRSATSPKIRKSLYG